MKPWRLAWHEALYGPSGFYRRAEGPAGHFMTSTHGSLGAVFASAIATLADREGVCRVVDIGCGRGELLAHLAAAGTDLTLVGVDVVDRPAGLPDRVGWITSPGGADLPTSLTELDDTLVLAHEWLDVVPCTIAQVDRAGEPREVLVDPVTGEESLGGSLTSEDGRWVETWWPNAVAGQRIEVGLTRDRAYASLCSRVRSGLVLAVDYGHTRADRPEQGTLTAYREGTLVTPVPDGSCDLTAHVALDSLGADEVTTQREALAALGITGERPDHALARTEPAAYLQALATTSAATVLRDSAGLGAFGWALTRI